jgi:hypothetical protein
VIAKHIPMNSEKKSSISGLIKYITDKQNKDERIELVKVTNCHQSDPLDAAIEMQAVQLQNQRSGADKTYHLVIAFPPGENPEAKILNDIEARICQSLGYGEHQRASAVHSDTDNLHLHIAINKIHPEKLTIHTPHYDYKILGDICEKLEHEYDLEKVNHQAKKTNSQNRVDDMEHHSGIESLISWTKKECLDDLKAAQSWEELNKVLNDNGLDINLRGNGLVFMAADGTMIKASSVDRELSKPKLESRFGAFPSSDKKKQKSQRPQKNYQQKPLKTRMNTVELFSQYQNEKKQMLPIRAEQWEEARHKKDSAIKKVKYLNQNRRLLIKHMTKGRLVKKMLYAQASSAMKRDLKKIREQHTQDRQAINEQFKPQVWADWLKTKALGGNLEALEALRAREARQGYRENVFSGEGKLLKNKQDNITKKGTIIYKAGKAAIRDDGDRLQVSRAITKQSLQAVLEMAQAKYGQKITINGTEDFKKQMALAAATSKLDVIFSDPNLERYRNQLIDHIQKEKDHEQRRENRRRAASGSHVDAGSRSTVIRAGSDRRRDGIDGERGRVGRGRIRPSSFPIETRPPPQNRNSVRSLSEVDVVQLTDRSEVLLSSDVHNNLEQQRTKRIDGLRRNVSGRGINEEVQSAAEKYILERETKRLGGLDISKHRLYTVSDKGDVIYSGTRKVGDQFVALLKRDDEMVVLPINAAIAQRLKRMKVGETVSLTQTGTVKKKGRSR